MTEGESVALISNSMSIQDNGRPEPLAELFAGNRKVTELALVWY